MPRKTRYSTNPKRPSRQVPEAVADELKGRARELNGAPAAPALEDADRAARLRQAAGHARAAEAGPDYHNVIGVAHAVCPSP
jgi:hypothetical protein